MIRTRMIGAAGALALLTAPAVAVAHGDGHHDGKHAGKHHHKKKGPRDWTGRAVATVQSFADGELTLALPSGKTYTADVTKRTVVVCHIRPVTPAAKAAHDGPGKGRHGDDGATTTAPATTSAPPSTTTPPSTDPGRAEGRCGTDKLVAGAKVSDARLSLNGDTMIWKKVVVVS